MPWTDEQHAVAVAAVLDGLGDRQAAGVDVDLDPRVVESMALENGGHARHPRTVLPLHGRRLERALTSGRYERWATLVWRMRLAETAARSLTRRAAFTSGDLNHAMKVSAALRKGRRP